LTMNVGMVGQGENRAVATARPSPLT
jgi:hypothetical protein